MASFSWDIHGEWDFLRDKLPVLWRKENRFRKVGLKKIRYVFHIEVQGSFMSSRSLGTGFFRKKEFRPCFLPIEPGPKKGHGRQPHRLRRGQAVLSQGPSQEVRLSQLDEVPPLGASEINGKAEAFSTGYHRSQTFKLDIYVYIYIHMVCIYIYICMYVGRYVCMYVCMWYRCIFIYLWYRDIHIYIWYRDVYIYIYIYDVLY